MNEIVKKNGIFFGILTGLVSVLSTTLIYVIDMSLFASWWLGLSIIAIYIIIACILLSKTKKELKGVFSFKEAFTTYFLSAVIGMAIATTFNILLFNVVDPGAKETIKEISIESAVSFMEKFGTPQAEINKQIQQMQETDQYAVGTQIKGYFIVVLVCAVFGLILAAIFKSKSSNKI